MQAEKQAVMVSDSLLLVVALIWGFGFVAQRAGMEHVGPYTYNGIRFLLGGLCLLPFALQTSREERPDVSRAMSSLTAGFLAGLVLFAGASLQQVGLVYTSAGKAGFITGLYVIFVPVFGLLFRKKTGIGTWTGALLATAGMYLLSVQNDFSIAGGDLLVLMGAVFWAIHVLLLGFLSPRTIPVQLAMGQFLFCGLFSLIVAFLTESIVLQSITDATLPILYGGLCSVGIGYTLQIVAQRRAHPAHAAILLSLEAVFAAAGGWWILDETLSARGITGCSLMLTGMLLSQMWPAGRQKPKPDHQYR